MQHTFFVQCFSSLVVALGAGSLRDATRLNCALWRSFSGFYRTPLLHQQVKRLKLDPNAPFPSERTTADVVWLR